MAQSEAPAARRNLLSYVEQLPRFAARDAYLWREGVRWRRRTYADLHRRVLACAAALGASGLRRGDAVLVQGPDGADWVEALLGTLWAGGVVVPLEPATPDDLRARIAARSGARVLIAPASIPAPPETGRLELGSWGERAAEATGARGDPSAEDRAEILFTSGTTGDPKGVVLTHGNLVADFQPIERAYFRREALVRAFGPLRFLSTLPLSHMFGQALNVFLPLTMGLTVVFVPPRPRDILETASRLRAWGLFTVPRVLDLLGEEVLRELAAQGALEETLRLQERLADRPFYVQALGLRKIRRLFGWRFLLLVSGGAALPDAVDRFWRRSGYLVVQGYGLTETAPIVSVSNPFDRRSGGVGRPMSMQEVKLGAGDEVLVRGPNVTPGYLGGEDAAALNDGWLRTGDVGELDEGGRLRIRGRLKEIVVTAEGENVHPGDVEAAFAGLPGVRGVAVIGLPLDRGERVHAVLLLDPGTDPLEAVRGANERLLPKQRVRGHTVWLEEDFPRTSTGKVRKVVLRERVQAMEQGGAGTGGSGPRPPASAARRLIGALARVAPESLRDDTRLVDGLGFGSLDLVELAASFEEEFGVALPEDRLGEASVGDLERLVLEAAGSSGTVAAPAAAGGHTEDRAASIPGRAAPAAPPGSAGERTPIPPPGADESRRGALSMPRWTRRLVPRLARRVIEELAYVPIVRFYARPEVVGLEHVLNVPQPCLFVPNHRSFMDTGLLKGMLPRPLRGRIAPGMTTRYHRVFYGETPGTRGRYFKEAVQARLAEFFFNVWPLPETAGFRASVAYAGELMDAGSSILIFPEGRHVPPPAIEPFRKGIGIFARDLRAPVVPVYVEGTERVLPEGRYWPRRGRTRITFGPPLFFAADADPGESTRRIEAAVRRLSAPN